MSNKNLCLTQDALDHLAVSMEGTGRSKFSESVANHFFADVDLNKLAALVNQERRTHKFRRNLGITSPRLDGLFSTRLLLLEHFAQKLLVYVWSFFT